MISFSKVSNGTSYLIYLTSMAFETSLAACFAKLESGRALETGYIRQRWHRNVGAPAHHIGFAWEDEHVVYLRRSARKEQEMGITIIRPLTLSDTNTRMDPSYEKILEPGTYEGLEEIQVTVHGVSTTWLVFPEEPDGFYYQPAHWGAPKDDWMAAAKEA